MRGARVVRIAGAFNGRERREDQVKKNKIIGTVLGLTSLLFLYMTWTLPTAKNSATVGPRTFPYLAAGGLLLCSIALLLQKEQKRDTERTFLDKAGWIRVAKLLGLLVMFPILFHFTGFLVASFAFLFLMIRLFDLEREVKLFMVASVSLAITAFMYGVFVFLLKIQLPHGALLDLIRR
jgi:heme A synthase